MSEKYRIRDNDKPYFITITTVGWIDVFTRLNNKKVIIDSINYCIKNKGLLVYAWCLMTNHLHIICQSNGQISLSDIIRDFKTYTSKKILQNIIEEPESRREWMIPYFAHACSHLQRNQHYKIWQDGFHPEEISGVSFLYEKLEYIHKNPVTELIVQEQWEYLFSSARNYADLDGLIDVIVLDHKPLIYNR